MLLVLLVVVVAVRCRKLISTLSWIVGGLFGDYWSLFGLFIGSVRRPTAESNHYTVGIVRRTAPSSCLALDLLLACSCLALARTLWGAGQTAVLS